MVDKKGGCAMFLPANEVWVGFDEAGMSVAASIEKRKPTIFKGSVMEGCAQVLKCKSNKGESVFSHHVSSFEVLK